MFCMSELCILVDEKVFIFTYVLLPTLLGYVNVCMSVYDCVRQMETTRGLSDGTARYML